MPETQSDAQKLADEAHKLRQEYEQKVTEKLDEIDEQIEILQEARQTLATSIGASTPASTPRRSSSPQKSIEERIADATAIVKDRPGIGVGELTSAMGLSRNYVGKVLENATDKIVRRDGKVYLVEHKAPAPKPAAAKTPAAKPADKPAATAAR